MIVFILKSLVAALMIYFVMCFYGNVSDHLFLKAFVCIIFLLSMYWVDIYRLLSIFAKYFIAVNKYNKNKMVDAYRLFEELIQKDFAPALPYLTIMRFQGEGSIPNSLAAKYHAERAVRNDYFECLYLLAVVDFFGNTLDPYFTSKNGFKLDTFADEKTSKKEHHFDPSLKISKKLKNINNELAPDYNECFYHLDEYFLHFPIQKNINKVSKVQYFGDACALYAYCLATGKGCETNTPMSHKFFKLAQINNAKNVKYLQECVEHNTEPTMFTL